MTIPPEYRIYVRDEDIPKLQRLGIKINVGRYGGKYIDKRELKSKGITLDMVRESKVDEKVHDIEIPQVDISVAYMPERQIKVNDEIKKILSVGYVVSKMDSEKLKQNIKNVGGISKYVSLIGEKIGVNLSIDENIDVDVDFIQNTENYV